MSRFRVRSMAVAIAVALMAAACGGRGGGGGPSDDEDATATTAAAAAAGTATSVPVATTVAASGPSTSFTLRITDVQLVNSEESDSGMRVLLPPGVANASVTLTGVPSPNRTVSVCQARELDRRLGGASCRTPANGEAATLTLGSEATGVEIIQIGVSGTGPAANTTDISEILVRYSAGTREISVRFPQIAAGDAGGKPTLSLRPASSDGAYRAQLTWTVIPVFGGTPSAGQLELVQSGSVTSKAEGTGADVRLNGNVPNPAADPVLRVANTGTSALVTPKVNALLP